MTTDTELLVPHGHRNPSHPISPSADFYDLRIYHHDTHSQTIVWHGRDDGLEYRARLMEVTIDDESNWVECLLVVDGGDCEEDDSRWYLPATTNVLQLVANGMEMTS